MGLLSKLSSGSDNKFNGKANRASSAPPVGSMSSYTGGNSLGERVSPRPSTLMRTPSDERALSRNVSITSSNGGGAFQPTLAPIPNGRPVSMSAAPNSNGSTLSSEFPPAPEKQAKEKRRMSALAGLTGAKSTPSASKTSSRNQRAGSAPLEAIKQHDDSLAPPTYTGNGRTPKSALKSSTAVRTVASANDSKMSSPANATSTLPRDQPSARAASVAKPALAAPAVPTTNGASASPELPKTFSLSALGFSGGSGSQWGKSTLPGNLKEEDEESVLEEHPISESDSDGGQTDYMSTKGDMTDDDASSIEYDHDFTDESSAEHSGTGSSGSAEVEHHEDAPPPKEPTAVEAVIAAVAPTRKNKPLHRLTQEDVALTEAENAQDLLHVWKAMHLFMNSRMIEAEDICLAAADHRLYFSVGYSLIQSMKALISFEPEDMEAAIQCCRDSLVITNLLRKKDSGIISGIGKLVRGSSSVSVIRSMTVVERHAELIFAECTLLKSILGIIYSGDFLAFLKEAMNLRNGTFIYKYLMQYLDAMDAEAGGFDASIDQDLRSGIYLGNGITMMILSYLPTKVTKALELFGFSGDGDAGLVVLEKAGGWRKDPEAKQPLIGVQQEGIRRIICDLCILFNHLLNAAYLPIKNVDIGMASKIIEFNIARYPEGFFFLYFSGRLAFTQALSETALRQFKATNNAQREYVQIQHICHWDMALVNLGLGAYERSYQSFNILSKESNWSKAIYAYARAVALYESDPANAPEAIKIMQGVPGMRQRIAGKTIPLEKFAGKKAQRFIAQGGRLLCPAIEMTYFFNALPNAPRFALFGVHLDAISKALADLRAVKTPASYGTQMEYWDDFCYAHFFRGVLLRLIAHPEPHHVVRPAECPIAPEEADTQALVSFRNVLKHGKDLRYDHHLVLFAHYEIGRLYDCRGEYAAAIQHFDMVMTGKGLELSKTRTGKVSMHSMAVLRTSMARSNTIKAMKAAKQSISSY
ncbi:uncharacterized protein L969DRAFT_90212 [Mixia osmundae IAM 14324]|uniref:Uncharacterized protein n=1 Tax=Mixia osmundae (strain CBS 9802 / IAM 14324 / JCM 22182 / KY 12970) TaxID=764103 RepID=G7DZG4_MIXOS|nr:uncharacterized protein L969DRAFT_90212 [Mixia osmundae IAM 14324]KEI37145.1 hypothetical protein L969DRAFT_90212 [Mixia osmundae IAM 14324]GAA95974.1 hypothetical protein E5Q_02632 [Mixia osmundae IAM 14324]